MGERTNIMSTGRNRKVTIRGKVVLACLASSLLVAVCASTAVKAQGNPVVSPLQTVIVPPVPNLSDFIQNEEAAILLGKALFWDMQLGSDGIQACASCHFHAGADSRLKNQVNPGLLAGDSVFEIVGPNFTLNDLVFPFHRLNDPDDHNSGTVFSTNDVVSSQGMFLHEFAGVNLGSSIDFGNSIPDSVWNVGNINVRRVAARNAPSVINAVLNFTNFHDGRANNIFNGVNPFGPSDLENGVLVNNGGVLEERLVRIINSALASQAVGPPGSEFEMSFAGRTFADIGKKMLRLRPLAKQFVHPQDSVLGPFSRASRGQRGLRVSYAQMIRAAFQPQFWDNTDQIIVFTDTEAYWFQPEENDARGFQFANGTPNFLPSARLPLQTNEFRQIEANFAFFFGLAVQMYESTLISDDTPFDRFLLGNTSALTPEEQRGFDIFQNRGKCINCHGGSALTNASVENIRRLVPEESDLVATLSGVQEAPPVITVASGNATFLIDPLRTRIVFDLRVADIADITAAHIHVAPPGVDGPIIFPLTDSTFVDRLTGTVTEADFVPAGGLTTFAEALDAMDNGDTYINVHTLGNPGGEIRGRILVDILNLEADLSGDQVVPPVVTDATAVADFSIDAARTLIEVSMDILNISSIAEIYSIYINSGLPGENGPIMFDLSDSGIIPCVPAEPAACFELENILGPGDLVPSPGITTFGEALDIMLTESAYIALHTLTNMDGEIRGRIVIRPEDPIAAIELMNMAQGRAFYDQGFYNISMTLTNWDIGRGGTDPFGFPLSFARLAMLKEDGLLPPGLDEFVQRLPLGVADPPNRVAANGSFKTPGLRNVELTSPYFHNGGIRTLRQVVDFYTRGGNFPNENIDDFDPDIQAIGGMDEAAKDALVAFLLALTDEHVRNESAPFDHPQLFVPNGSRGDENGIIGDCANIGPAGDRECEQFLVIPAVGAAGRSAQGLPPLDAGVNHFQP